MFDLQCVKIRILHLALGPAALQVADILSVVVGGIR